MHLTMSIAHPYFQLANIVRMVFSYDGDGHNDSNDDNDGEDNMIFEIDEQQVWKCEALNIDGVKVKQSKK